MEQTKTIVSDKLLMDQFHKRDWKQLWLKLMGRCVWVLSNRYNVKWHNDELKDFSRNCICEVIEKIFVEKKRKWNINRYPDFEKFIIGAIDSHINNTLNKKSKEYLVGNDEYILDTDGESKPTTIERITANEFRNQVFDELQKAGAQDDELLIFECLADGIEKPKDIKKELGLSDNDFHNAWRRLKRKRKIIQQKVTADGY